ncbi:hypothetical protein ASU31_15200 [Pedobacter ginsenosidimutans]|uniref:Uncharacterized protein n=1 Tax=Pedobacter ginsenosidimutans TaxID=687842 RepID=A0A0T5VMV4_9SPHI|nr:hypothetical protein ASU31_15200 [Pedobacter ginsenosidimutans]
MDVGEIYLFAISSTMRYKFIKHIMQKKLYGKEKAVEIKEILQLKENLYPGRESNPLLIIDGSEIIQD